MSEHVAIAAWRYHCGLVKMDVWLKPRGQAALDKVNELIEMRFNEVLAETAEGGVFVLWRNDTSEHTREFYDWCHRVQR